MSRLYYLAHPVAGDVTEHVARAIRWLRYLSLGDRESVYIAPWIATIMAIGSDEDVETRRRALDECMEVVRRCDGIVLVGGRISPGMRLELEAALATGKEVIDLTVHGAEPPKDRSPVELMEGV